MEHRQGELYRKNLRGPWRAVWENHLLRSARSCRENQSEKLRNKGDYWEGELFVFKRRSWYDVSMHEENDTLYLVISVGFFEKEVQWPRG